MPSLSVPEHQRGVQLEDFLAQSFPAVDRVQLRRLARQGAVRVNRMVAAPGMRLCDGDFVELAEDPAALRARPAAEPDLEVLFESATALVVSKPAGLPTVPDRFRKGTSVHAALPELRPDADLRIVHRLDRDTSGCLLLAKGVDAARHFDRQFRGGLVEKQYLALVEGTTAAAFSITDWLGPDRARPGKVVARKQQARGFRAAQTDVEREREFARHTLLRLFPRTGRGHQLRVHLAAHGHPIVADTDYGGSRLLLSEHKRGYKLRPGCTERPLLDRMFLHAERLAFVDLDGTAVDVTAPLPQDLQQVLVQLARFDRGRR